MVLKHRKNGFPVTIEIPAQKYRKSLNSASEVREFIEGEAVYWDQLAKGRGSWTTNSQGLFDTGGQAAANAAVNETRSIGELDDEGAINILTKFLATDPLLSNSPYGGTISAAAEASSPFVPGLVFIFSLLSGGLRTLPANLPQGRLTPVDLAMLAGAVSHHVALASSPPDKQLLESLLTELQTALDAVAEAKAELAEAKLLFEFDSSRAIAEFENDGIDLVRRSVVELAERKGNLEEYQAAMRQRIDHLRSELTVDIVTKAPTVYWRNKARWHIGTALIFGLIFLSAIGLGAWALFVFGLDYISLATTKILGSRSDAGGLAALVPLIFITVPSLALAWALRHISRVIVQNLALSADARLRSTIAQSYKALVAEGSASDAHLALVLQALFRPFDTKDAGEIAPPSFKDLMDTKF
jgi:hypothetical protein